MILHLALTKDWEKAQITNTYRTSSLDTEGFIHCSTHKQLLSTANKHFKDENDLVLLVIDPDKVSARVVYENADADGDPFPHIYGSLEVDAVIEKSQLSRDQNGLFATLPNLKSCQKRKKNNGPLSK